MIFFHFSSSFLQRERLDVVCAAHINDYADDQAEIFLYTNLENIPVITNINQSS